jgi:hypothetical protein
VRDCPYASEGALRKRTDSNEPRPGAGEISENKQVWHDRMEHEYSSPHIKGVVAIIGEQERVMNAGDSVHELPKSKRHERHEGYIREEMHP